MKFYKYMKINGELACRNLSDKAYKVYCDTEPLNIYEYETDEKLYAFDGALGSQEGLTFDELEAVLEAFAD